MDKYEQSNPCSITWIPPSSPPLLENKNKIKEINEKKIESLKLNNKIIIEK